MTATVSLFVICLTCLVTEVRLQGRDLTLVPGASGPDVVRAVIAKLTFSNILFNHQSNGEVAPFMRTMAYVETRDGTEQNPSGGGIWNIREALFDEIKLRHIEYGQIITQLMENNPQNHIGPVDWNDISYINLTSPLYSGLVVRIRIHLTSTPLQASDFFRYWDFVFKARMGIESQWDRGVRDLANIENCSVDTDLMYVLDESGSIGAHNFLQVKDFVYNFSRELLQDNTASRVGVITFDSSAFVHIELNNSLGREELLSQIAALPYDGGGTNTALGLDLMRQQPWRDEVSVIRLAIVVTDGRSNSRPATEIAAQAVHDHTPSIAVYAIGVGGGIDEEELRSVIATRPETYSHLDSFSTGSFTSVAASYSYQICFTESQDVTLQQPESGTLERGATSRLRFTVPVDEGLTFRLCISEGRIIIYASTIPNPSSAQHNWRGVVRTNAHPINCLTSFYEISESNNRRKRRQLPSTELATIYITLEGQEEVNMFNFNSSANNVTLDENECEDNPCDQNAKCTNTDGSFFCECLIMYTGNGTHCFAVETEVPVPVMEDIRILVVIITLSVAMVIFGLIILLAAIFGSCRHINAKKQQTLTLDDKQTLTSNMEVEDNDYEPYVPIEVDVNLFNIQEGEKVMEKAGVETVLVTTSDDQRFVPKMVRKYEGLAAELAEANRKAKRRTSKQQETNIPSKEDDEEETEPGITRI